MRPISSPRMHVVRKEEKEARLTAFIAKQLADLTPADTCDRRLTVLARSAESPVLKALAAHGAALTEAGYDIRVMIVQTHPGPAADVAAFLKGVTMRVSHDVRLLDAHEQLALGSTIAWLGDCMRREPAKRDAYECYSTECAETAAYAHRSFERVWSFAGTRRFNLSVSAAEPVKPATPVELAAAALSESETAPLVSTRH